MTRRRFALPPTLLTRLALIMLAAGAAHGVYAFARLFVSPLFAAILAGAFELTYIGLATWQTADEAERVRARRISLGAVTVSISYNAIAAFLGRNPDALGGLSGAGYWATEGLLAALFGAPLALVAYLLADLVLHRGATDATTETSDATGEALAALVAEQRATTERQLGAMRSLVEELRSEVALLPATGPATDATSGVQCEDCGASFASPRALGGHRSRCKVRQNGHAGAAR